MLFKDGPVVSINLVVHNGEKYIRRCLDSVLAQTYLNVEINILDNNSSDATAAIIETFLVERGFSAKPSHPIDILIYQYANELKRKISWVKSGKNLGTWPGQEKLLEHSRGEYIVALSVDVVLDPHFIEEAIKVFEKDGKIGAIQPKVYKYNLMWGHRKTEGSYDDQNILDTCGFQIFRSRRIINIGHGEEDRGQFNEEKEIFAVEGAVPVFRKQALEDCRLKSQSPSIVRLRKSDNWNGGRIIDPDFFWYGDDLDLAWRMRLFGWKQIFAPKVIAWHDRQTTKALAGGSWREFIKIRKTVPMFKRRLDWRNITLAIIKNDFAVNFLRDLPFIFWRQLRLWGYFLLFEPAMFLEIFGVAKLLPKMLKRRGEIMREARISAKEMRRWFL